MKDEEDLVAISGDLVGSRKIPSRAEISEKLDSTLPELARRFRSHWEAPPQMTRGLDEFSAAMSSAESPFRFFVALNEAIWPHRFRLGVGIGGLDVGRESGLASRLDGPAFHRAAEALADAHAALTKKWSKSSARFVPMMRLSEHQREVASTCGVTQQVVSKALIRANYKTLVRIEEAATRLLADGAPDPQTDDIRENTPDVR